MMKLSPLEHHEAYFAGTKLSLLLLEKWLIRSYSIKKFSVIFQRKVIFFKSELFVINQN